LYPNLVYTFCNPIAVSVNRYKKTVLPKFGSPGCVLQEVGTGRKFGSGESCDGLYVLKDEEHEQISSGQGEFAVENPTSRDILIY